jgi:hypothetical protein
VNVGESMVDAVVVEKEVARQAFETEVREGGKGPGTRNYAQHTLIKWLMLML